MSNHWSFENQQLFGYSVTQVKTTVFKVQRTTLFTKGVQNIIKFNFCHTKLLESIDDMWNCNMLHWSGPVDNAKTTY